MIINRDVKAIFIEVPKTGSTTIRNQYVQTVGKENYHRPFTHTSPSQIERAYPDEDLSGYTQYAFYRDPLERLISGWRYSIFQFRQSREIEGSVMCAAAEKVFVDVYGAKTLDDMTFEMFFDAIKTGKQFPTHDLNAPQTRWFTEETVLLDFRNFDQEALRLMRVLKMDLPDQGLVARENVTDSAKHISILSQSLIEDIIKFYTADYEFFAKRGISFQEDRYINV